MSLTARILALTATNAAVATGLVLAAEQSAVVGDFRPVTLVAAVVFGLVGSLTVHIELRRHACAVTVVEAVFVASLFHLSPLEVVAAATLGETLACLARRQPLLQLAFNATGAAATFGLGALVFALLDNRSPLEPTAWISALAGCAAYALANHASTSAVLSIVEQRRFAQVFAASAAPAAVASTVSATIGLLAVLLAGINPVTLLLVAPLVVLMVVETRKLADHRADHLRFERLYAASARTGGLRSQQEAMTSLAEEARSLVTGAAALCCTVDRSGEWHGFVVDDRGSRPVTPSEMAAVRALSSVYNNIELQGSHIPAALARLTTPLASLVVASTDDDAAAPVAIVVARQLPGNELAHARADVLAAFIGHAALTVANARLYGDVEDALAHQVDLNRQRDDFVAAVSHELRTPLTSMIGSMASMRRLGDRLTPEKQAMLVDVALRQGDRLKQLIEDLLLLSAIEAPRQSARDATVIDVRALVADVATDFGERTDRAAVDIRFSTGLLPPLHGNEGQLRQILVNLVDNARKYAPGSPVEIAAEADGDVIRIHVSDHGPGIRAEDRERVFERFVQLDQSATRAQGGTGLGLYLCRQLARTLGGTLELSDAVGGGCRFNLELPALTIDLPHHHDVPSDRGDLVAALSVGSVQ